MSYSDHSRDQWIQQAQTRPGGGCWGLRGRAEVPRVRVFHQSTQSQKWGQSGSHTAHDTPSASKGDCGRTRDLRMWLSTQPHRHTNTSQTQTRVIDLSERTLRRSEAAAPLTGEKWDRAHSGQHSEDSSGPAGPVGERVKCGSMTLVSKVSQSWLAGWLRRWALCLQSAGRGGANQLPGN